MWCMSARGRIPVEFYFDDQLGTWHFHVDEPRIVGGGQLSLDEARQAAAEAIAFALEGEESQKHDGQVEYLDVAVG
jgi:predicted RNase H-like HicB family nuclease